MSAIGLVVELVAGAIGGAAGTSFVGALVPALENVGHVDMSGLATQAVSGGVLGAILTAVVAAIRNASTGAPAA